MPDRLVKEWLILKDSSNFEQHGVIGCHDCNKSVLDISSLLDIL